MVSNKRYEEMTEFYDKQLDRVTKDRDYWREQYYKKCLLNDKAEIYEAILTKQGILGESSEHTDKTFVFEGKIYRPIEFTLSCEPGRASTLSVDFVEVS